MWIGDFYRVGCQHLLGSWAANGKGLLIRRLLDRYVYAREKICSYHCCLTRRCSGGHEVQFLWFLSTPLVAPLNAGVRCLPRCNATYGVKQLWDNVELISKTG